MPIDDVLLDKLGEFYCSEYVALNQPWIREIPFEQWVERQLKGGQTKDGIRLQVGA